MGRIERSVDNYSVHLMDVFNFASEGLELEWNGDKFRGSFGATKLFTFVDYWTLRKRSMQLFTENIYCKGIIRRMMRNEIFTGLVPDASPIASILWNKKDPEEREASEQRAVEFGEMMTEQFNLYAANYNIFDYRKELTFGEFQEQCRREAIICGDGIIVSRINPLTNLPYWDWINGNYIRTPIDYTPRSGNYIRDGVELDPYGRHVAYHVQRIINGKEYSERIPVKGEKSGRQISWMVYGSERMIDDVRGEPLLACMLYMLKELDRYRDAEARAAVINSLIAIITERAVGADPSSDPLASIACLNTPGGAPLAKDEEEKGTPALSFIEPGMAVGSATAGEKITSYSTQRPNVNYKAFEDAILNAICWALEVPPEIVKLQFQSSYSASRQADNEFQVYLKYRTYKNAKDFCQIIYEEFIIQAVLTGIIKLPGFVQSVLVERDWQKRAAWLSCAWTGISRPNVDRNKDVSASIATLQWGLTTKDIECRRISGLSFRQVTQRYRREKDFEQQLGLEFGGNAAEMVVALAQHGKGDDEGDEGEESENGEKGDKGDRGEKGERGATGEQGPRGYAGSDGADGFSPSAKVTAVLGGSRIEITDKDGTTAQTVLNGTDGTNATFAVGTVTSGESPSVVNSGTSKNAVLDFVLPKGEKGDKGDDGEDGQDGKSFDIKGAYSTLAELEAEHPTGSAGEAYFVGSGTNPDLYIWLTDTSEWYNQGPIQGVKGDKGDEGEEGYSPTVRLSYYYDDATDPDHLKPLRVRITVQNKEGSANADVANGDKGDTGRGIASVSLSAQANGTHLLVYYDDAPSNPVDAGIISVPTDAELDATSANAIQNKAVAAGLETRLKVVSEMPATPSSGQVVLYIGESTASLMQGGIYLFDGADWKLISTAEVDLTGYKKQWNGTLSDWNALTDEEKDEYDSAAISDLAGTGALLTGVVEEGNENAVTSGAVWDAVNEKWTVKTLATLSPCTSADTYATLISASSAVRIYKRKGLVYLLFEPLTFTLPAYDYVGLLDITSELQGLTPVMRSEGVLCGFAQNGGVLADVYFHEDKGQKRLMIRRIRTTAGDETPTGNVTLSGGIVLCVD